MKISKSRYLASCIFVVNMEGDYDDEVGHYYGGLRDGIPHGSGTKYYKGNENIQGTWENGRIVGEAILTPDDEHVFHIRFKNGKLNRLLKIPEWSEIRGTVEAIPIVYPIASVEINSKYYEIFSGSSDNLYFATIVQGLLQFNGKLLNRRSLHITSDIRSDYAWIGETLNGVYHGYGQLLKQDHLYRGNFSYGKPHGKGKLLDRNGKLIKGIFENGQPHGACTVYFTRARDALDYSTSKLQQSEEIIETTFNYGQIHGISKQIVKGQLTYEGELSSDLTYEGYGTLYQNDDIITGIWKDSKIQGRAKITRADYTLEGEHRNDTFIGVTLNTTNVGVNICKMIEKRIRLIFPLVFEKNWSEYEQKCNTEKNSSINLYGTLENDNEKYFGEINSKKCEGKGEIVFANGEKYCGMWLNHKIHGAGTYYYNDGSIYRGKFKENMKDGSGILIVNPDYSYKGQWKNNMMHGKGILQIKNQKIYANWKENKIIGASKISTNRQFNLINLEI